MTTSFVPDALNQAVCQRCPAGESDGLIHQLGSGAANIYPSGIPNRLADRGPSITSVGSVGDSYDNALAESTIGLFKTEVINFLGPWKSMSQVEWETPAMGELVQYRKGLHSAIGHKPPQAP